MTFALKGKGAQKANNSTDVSVTMTGLGYKNPQLLWMSHVHDPPHSVFAFIGVFCGLGGALYVYLHRRYGFNFG